MRATALDPAEPCGYCGSAWEDALGGYAHTCRPVRARVVTLAESLEAYRARESERAARRRKRVAPPKPEIAIGKGTMRLVPKPDAPTVRTCVDCAAEFPAKRISPRCMPCAEKRKAAQDLERVKAWRASLTAEGREALLEKQREWQRKYRESVRGVG